MKIGHSWAGAWFEVRSSPSYRQRARGRAVFRPHPSLLEDPLSREVVGWALNEIEAFPLGHPFLRVECVRHDPPQVEMELRRGWTLRAALAAHVRFSSDDIVQVCRALCRAVEQAHREGVLLATLRLDSVGVDTAGELALTHPVIEARILRPTSVRALAWQESLAPEEFVGPPTEVGDFFRVAAIVYALCAGKHPFRRGTAFDTLEAIRRQDVRRVPEVPREREGELAAVSLALLQAAASGRAEIFEQLRQRSQGTRPLRVKFRPMGRIRVLGV